MRSLCGLLILSSLTVGQTNCPEPSFLPLTGYDVAFDPNRIVLYYAAEPNEPPARRKLLRPPYRVALGQSVQILDGWACDGDGDAMQLAAGKGRVTLNPDGTWTWLYTPAAIGLEYIDFTLTDVRATNDSKAVQGTVVVQTLPANRRPGFGCGSRP